MNLKWRDEDGSIKADSQIWHDEGSVMPYTIVYDVVDDIWVASFEGGEIGKGTLVEAIAMCQDAEKE